uniref:Uncharacterized protein n=1 Tax=Psilocybe cubensis TaxID=181762 RepID=A0A8H8CHP4_PSICU
MENEGRPPSYNTSTLADIYAGSSRNVLITSGFNLSSVTLPRSPASASSSSSSNFESFYDPSPEVFAQDIRRAVKRLVQRGPRYAHTVPPVVPTSSRRPLSTEKRPPTFLPKRTPAISDFENVTYRFEPSYTLPNTMTLVPQYEVDESKDRYTVNVNMNCFMPTSFVTRIFNMSNLIGEFEMGIINTEVSSKVRIGDKLFNIANILSKNGGRDSGTWFWNPLAFGTKFCLKWDYSTRPCTCSSTVGGMDVLATFTSPFGLNEGSNPPMLEVTPAGREENLFQHILISLLIVERKRLTPDRDSKLKELFN